MPEERRLVLGDRPSGGRQPGRTSGRAPRPRALFSDKPRAPPTAPWSAAIPAEPLLRHARQSHWHPQPHRAVLTTNIHVPVDTYRETWDKLAASEDWGSGFLGRKQADVYMGVLARLRQQDRQIKLIAPASPAERAGLKIDDVITQIDARASPAGRSDTFSAAASRMTKSR